MNLARLTHDPARLVEFFEEGLEALGAVCERTWHDRLHVVAEDRAARLWDPQGALVEREIHFPPADVTTARQADTEVFPGCPLTFRLAEALRPAPLSLGRVMLAPLGSAMQPDPEVAAKLWQKQHPLTQRFQIQSAFKAAFHFSLLVLVRCEIQAIDQHWSVYRMALSLPDGGRDEELARQIDFCDVSAAPAGEVTWPALESVPWKQHLQAALMEDLRDDLSPIRARQAGYLQRELDRIDRYFEGYQRELTARQARSRSPEGQSRIQARLTAAQAEHRHRLEDQMHRHEIRLLPHVDAMLFVAEPAWVASVQFQEDHQACRGEAEFNPRSRHWTWPLTS